MLIEKLFLKNHTKKGSIIIKIKTQQKTNIKYWTGKNMKSSIAFTTTEKSGNLGKI